MALITSRVNTLHIHNNANFSKSAQHQPSIWLNEVEGTHRIQYRNPRTEACPGDHHRVKAFGSEYDQNHQRHDRNYADKQWHGSLKTGR